MRICIHIMKQLADSGERRLLLKSIIITALLMPCTFSLKAQVPDTLAPWWPQKYTVTLDKEKNILRLSTPYYLIEQNLSQGGNISKVKYTNGKNENLLIEPVGVKVNDAGVKEEYSDMVENPAQISYENYGNSVRAVSYTHLRAHETVLDLV